MSIFHRKTWPISSKDCKKQKNPASFAHGSSKKLRFYCPSLSFCSSFVRVEFVNCMTKCEIWFIMDIFACSCHICICFSFKNHFSRQQSLVELIKILTWDNFFRFIYMYKKNERKKNVSLNIWSSKVEMQKISINHDYV